ncbi:hypothetical protein GCM10010112_16520 [Actinoplanes lobatus]|uniref:Uncharacterized protein n=1 Tax=Actinoplanes lobatus TaxID=113568 RepID=A0ABQ4AJT6_9ACTN|nr:hypothetical protein GCM10010112_16520 [Actinoplanes lobatus]GIE41274.1 hypothetical protein Alo02nite_41720 [Actinoplanes lobatus]
MLDDLQDAALGLADWTPLDGRIGGPVARIGTAFGMDVRVPFLSLPSGPGPG